MLTKLIRESKIKGGRAFPIVETAIQWSWIAWRETERVQWKSYIIGEWTRTIEEIIIVAIKGSWPKSNK